MSNEIKLGSHHSPAPWNKGRLVGQKRPLRPKEVWAIRVRLQIKRNKRDLAMFNLAIDSKLRGCDLVSLRIDDIAVGYHARDRATIVQHKTGRPVQFEITEQTRASLQEWLTSTSFRAAFTSGPMCRRANTHASSMAGSRAPGWTAAPMAPIRCAAPRRRRSTARPVICVQFSCFSDIRRSRAPSVTLGSKSMMP
jgi:integrase